MEVVQTNLDQLAHLRIILGVLVGLSITRLATGVAKFVQHPKANQIYGTHLIWVVFIFLSVVHFWWFEFRLTYTRIWTFEYYLFLITYAVSFFFISALLFPDNLSEYSGFKDYFHARQKWFYGLLVFCYLIDLADSYFKGADYYQTLGYEYLVRQLVMISLAFGAVFIKNRRFHFCFSIFAVAVLVLWIAVRYSRLA